MAPLEEAERDDENSVVKLIVEESLGVVLRSSVSDRVTSPLLENTLRLGVGPVAESVVVTLAE